MTRIRTIEFASGFATRGCVATDGLEGAGCILSVAKGLQETPILKGGGEGNNGEKHGPDSQENTRECRADEKGEDDQGTGSVLFFIGRALNKPVRKRAVPANVMAGLLALVPLMLLDRMFDFLPTGNQPRVSNPRITFKRHVLLQLQCVSTHKHNPRRVSC